MGPRDRKTNVLHVVESYGGGVVTAVDAYVAATADTARHHLLMRPRNASLSEGRTFENFATVHTVSKQWMFPREIRHAIRRESIDVIHAHSSYAGVHTRIAVRSKVCPIIYTPHCFAFERQDLSALQRRLFRFAELALARFNTSIIAACSEHETETAASLGKTVAAVYLPNVADELFERAGPVVKHDAGHLIGIGRLDPQKDPDFFLDVTQSARQHDPRIRATWIGAGDPETVAKLESHNVTVTGWMSKSEIIGILLNGGVYIHTARWEGFPMTILEAHALKLPILVRETPSFSTEGNLIGALTAHDLATKCIALNRSYGGIEDNIRSWQNILRPNTRSNQAMILDKIYSMHGGGRHDA